MSTYLIKDETLTDIANAIREKTGDSEAIQVSDFDTAISNIPTGGDLSEYFNTEINVNDFNAFFMIKKAPTLTLSNEVTSLNGLFGNCFELEEVDVSSFDTSNITDMSYMFSSCEKLTTLNVSNFNTSNVTSMYGMFDGCSALESLDLSSFETSNVTDMNYLFLNCYSIQELDISNFDFSNVTGHDYIFGNMLGDATIYVKDATAQSWILNLSNDDRPVDWSTDNVIIKV